MKIRSILHLDLDAFYASVEQLDNPSLKDRPVIVGGSVRRGVVSAASYEARRFGVHSAMPMFRAVRQCPTAAVLPVRMARYAEVSRQVFAVFEEFTPLIEPLSLDEAFLDVTASEGLFGPAVNIAQTIRQRVRSATGLTISAGAATNKFLAKIASDLGKPDGLTVVDPNGVLDFLGPLPVSRIWGVGKAGEKILRDLGVRTIKDLRSISLHTLHKRFGAMGQRLFELARGIDDRPVELPEEPKSLGHEDTFGEDLTDRETIKRRLLDLSERVARRLRRNGLAGRTVTLKVKYADFTSITRSRTMKSATDDGKAIYTEILRLLDGTAAGSRPLRLLGISLSNLNATGEDVQAGLFATQDERGKRLNTALDRLASRFGPGVVVRSSLLEEPEE